MDQWEKPDLRQLSLQNSTHVWRLNLEPDDAALQKLQAWLSKNEQTRAERIRHHKHRNHFIASRSQIRIILSSYLNIDNEKLKFDFNDFGKPFLDGNPLYFNLSHSHNMALLAINAHYEVGVDIEWIHRKTRYMDIGKRFFSQNEFYDLNALPSSQQRKGFFNCWTRKESYIKARGKGLGIPLADFEVSLIPDEPVRLKSTRHDPPAVNCWTLYAFEPGPDYTAALTINSKPANIKLIDGFELLDA